MTSRPQLSTTWFLIHTVRKKPLIIALSVIVFVLMLFVLIPRKPNKSPNQEPTATATPNPLPRGFSESAGFAKEVEKSLRGQPAVTNNMQTLISKLPHQTPNYTIEYDPLQQKIYISIHTPPYQKYETEAKTFIQHYVPNLSQLNLIITYLPPKP